MVLHSIKSGVSVSSYHLHCSFPGKGKAKGKGKATGKDVFNTSSTKPKGAPGRTLRVIEGILGKQILMCCDTQKAGWRPGGKGTNCCATQKAGRATHGPTGAKGMDPQTTMERLAQKISRDVDWSLFMLIRVVKHN